jgi:hypothetical protein
LKVSPRESRCFMVGSFLFDPTLELYPHVRHIDVVGNQGLIKPRNESMDTCRTPADSLV